MKKQIIRICAISVLLSISFAQQVHKNGIGFEFITLPADIMSISGLPIGVYFPIETGSLLFEPYFSYFHTSVVTKYNDDSASNNNTSSESTYWSLLVGIFMPHKADRLRSYAGLRIGMRWLHSGGNDDKSFVIAPTAGAEYFIGDNFSFGGEAMLSFDKSEDKSDDRTITTKISRLIPKFIVRFYF